MLFLFLWLLTYLAYQILEFVALCLSHLLIGIFALTKRKTSYSGVISL